MHETIKLLGKNKSKIIKKKENGENAAYLELTEVALTQFITVSNDYQEDSRVLCTFVPN